MRRRRPSMESELFRNERAELPPLVSEPVLEDMAGEGDPGMGGTGIDVLAIERRYWDAGVLHVAGVDEAGIGSLAGPVVAAAVILPVGIRLEGVNDSKQLTARQRAAAVLQVRLGAVGWAIGFAEVEEVNHLNVYHAGLLAMERAVAELEPVPGQVLVDGRTIPGCGIPQTRVVGGDRRSHCIAAASVLAKTTRDAIMKYLDREYPGYGFAAHKGYATPGHREALSRMGPCPAHRASFDAVADYAGGWSARFLEFRARAASADSLQQLEAVLAQAVLTSPPLTRRELKRIEVLCGRRKRLLGGASRLRRGIE